MTPSLPDTFKRDILAFRRLLHQFVSHLLLVIILLTPFLTTLSSVVFTFNQAERAELVVRSPGAWIVDWSCGLGNSGLLEFSLWTS